MSSSFTSQLTDLENQVRDVILDKVEMNGLKDANPQYNIKSLDIKEFEVFFEANINDTKQAMYIDHNGSIYDEDGYIYNLNLLSLESLCNLADNL